MPETPEAMLNVPGVTKANYDKYGPRLLEILVKYAAEKDTLILESNMANMTEYDTQGPSTSKGNTNSKVGTSRQNGRSNGDDEEWISVDQEARSKYFGGTTASPRKRKTASRKPTRANFWKTKGKSSWKKAAAGKRKSTVTPQKSTAKRAGTSGATNSKSSSAGVGGLGFMPAPQPKKMKF